MKRISRTTHRRQLRPIALLAMTLFVVVGCESVPKPRVQVPPPAQGIPSYQYIAERYNKNLAYMSQMWARADVEFTWYDQKGRKKFESGDDSRLILVLPDRLALSVGKLGHEFIWAGYNDERYWLFDLTEDKPVYVGRHENFGKPGTRRLPTPVRPMDLPRLLGLFKLSTEDLPTQPQVMWWYGAYVVEPPGTRTRVSIDPKTFLPVRVDLLDAFGQSTVIGKLYQHGDVSLHKVPEKDWPRVAKRQSLRVFGVRQPA